ncbi:MAG: ATP-binding protein, partial [Bacteroidota bacterium]|nr:ATP-binding protein [Bacteroidota bacterium]
LSTTALNLLKAIGSGETQITAQEVLQTYKLGTPRNATKARDVLIGKDIIERTKAGFAFLDPGFELWFKREFLGKPVVLKLDQ